MHEMFMPVFLFYLVLSVDIPSIDPWEQHAAQDIQSAFCSSGCLSGSSECPIHDTCWRTESQINERKSVSSIKTELTALNFYSCHGMLEIQLGVLRDANGLKPSPTGAQFCSLNPPWVCLMGWAQSSLVSKYSCHALGMAINHRAK